MPNQPWHLEKSVSVTIIGAIVCTMMGGAVAWANMEGEVADNTENIELMSKKVTAIYDGLLFRQLIEPIVQ